MPSPPPKPSSYAVPGGVLSLSGPALMEFLQAALAKGAAFRFRAPGPSMYPFIKDSDLVTILPVPGRRLHLGDVAAFCHPVSRRLAVHRIIKKSGQNFLLQGDNCSEADGLVPAGDIIGRVTEVEGTGRYVRLGLGPLRPVLALLSRYHLLQPVLRRTRLVLGPVLRLGQGKL